MEQNKAGVIDSHKDAWVPDVVVGTSIGAVNGAAITLGRTAEELEAIWLKLRSEDVMGLPPGMSAITRGVVNQALKRVIGTPLPQMTETEATSPPKAQSWLPAPILPAWVNNIILGRWSNLLDTGPLARTLSEQMQITPEALESSDKTLLISTTNVKTGAEQVFSNKPVYRLSTGDPHERIATPITINRIVASCSIPMVYPWTSDSEDVYWDGAIVSNTPLSSAFHAVGDRPIEEDMEIMVVIMTPWVERGEPAPSNNLPDNFADAVIRTLDWALLASFRNELAKTKLYRRLVETDRAAGYDQKYRYVKDIMIAAPDEFQSIARIITYEENATRNLIQKGYDAAKETYQAHFGA